MMNDEVKITEEQRRLLQIEFARRVAEMVVSRHPAAQAHAWKTPLQQQPRGPMLVVSAAVAVLASLADHQQRNEVLRKQCVACALGTATFCRADNGHVRFKCACGLIEGME